MRYRIKSGAASFCRTHTISGRKVYLENATSLGFCVWEAKPGDWVIAYDDEGRREIGRVLGMVEETGSDGLENRDGYLSVLVLSDDLSSVSYRWIDPATVHYCRPVPPAAILAWITQETLPAPDVCLRLVEHGTASDMYISDPTCGPTEWSDESMSRIHASFRRDNSDKRDEVITRYGHAHGRSYYDSIDQRRK